MVKRTKGRKAKGRKAKGKLFKKTIYIFTEGETESNYFLPLMLRLKLKVLENKGKG